MRSPLLLQAGNSPSAWLGYVVFGLDRWLRQRQGVYEYTTNPSCLFRIQKTESEESLSLSDGTHIAAGDAILNLHLWNEQIPAMDRHGASVAWARQISHGIQMSLIELVRHMAEHKELDDVVAARADMRLGTTEQTAQLSRISSRYGFEAVATGTINSGALHRFGENIYLFLLVLATNPIALRTPVMQRDHALVYLSRTILEKHYGHAARLPARARKYRPC